MSTPLVQPVSGFSMRTLECSDGDVVTPRPILAVDPCGLACFALLPVTSGPSLRIDWDSVHTAIQGGLEELTKSLLLEDPTVAWRSGRSEAPVFPLLSYRVFDRSDGDDDDPVIAGVTITLDGNSARLAGDISGDETGCIYFDEGCQLEVPARQDEIVTAAALIANRLAVQWRIALDAIHDRDRRDAIHPPITIA